MILITGATGFLGRFIVNELLEKGHELRLLVRNAKDRSLPWGSLVEVADGDIMDVNALEKAMQGVEYVVHAAAVVSFARKRRADMKAVNVGGTANVVNAALNAGVKKLVHISSVATTGRAGNGEEVDEETPWQEGAYHNFYGRCKREAEMEVYRGIAEGLPAVMLNPALIIGAGDWSAGTPKIFTTLYKGLSFYNEGVTGYIWAADVARAVSLVMESDLEKGERFILSAENLDQKTFFTEATLGMGLKPPHRRLPRWLGAIIGFVSEAWAFMIGSEPLITREIMRSANNKTYYRADKIERLGLVYTPMKKVIRETAEAFLADQKS